MGERKKSHSEIKKNAREIHKNLKKKDSKEIQKLYHILMNQKQREIY